MSVLALLRIVRAFPEPAVEVLFDSIEEVSAGDIDAFDRFASAITRVSVNVDLGRLVFHCQVVRVLAALALLADACLEVGAEHGLGVLAFLQLRLLDEGNTLEKGLEQLELFVFFLFLFFCLELIGDTFLLTTSGVTSEHDLSFHIFHKTI